MGMKRVVLPVMVTALLGGAFSVASSVTPQAPVAVASTDVTYVVDCHANPASDDCMPDNYTSGDPWTVDSTCTLDDSPVIKNINFDTVYADAHLGDCDNGSWMVSPTLTSKIFWTTCDRRDGEV